MSLLFANFNDRRDARSTVSVGLVPARLLLLLTVFLCAGSVKAMPLDEYRSRIHQAVIELDQLWDDEENGTGADYAARVGVVFDKVRELVPQDETIDWEGGRVRVNNSWLGEELKSYQRMTPDDSRREDALERTGQRLFALEERLDEISGQKESASTSKGNESAAPTKEQEKARLEAILRREEYSGKPPEKSVLERIWERIKEWWNNLFPGRSVLQPGQSSWLSVIAMILIFGLAAGVLSYSIWKFTPFFGRWRGGSRLKLEKRAARIVLGERLEADKTAADLLAEAETLARKGELRAAIRKGYVALLCELGDRKVITLAQHKTNHDYLRAVREKRPLLNEMQKLTASFENHWYGYVPTTPNDWTAFRSGYQQTLKTASLLSDK